MGLSGRQSPPGHPKDPWQPRCMGCERLRAALKRDVAVVCQELWEGTTNQTERRAAVSAYQTDTRQAPILGCRAQLLAPVMLSLSEQGASTLLVARKREVKLKQGIDKTKAESRAYFYTRAWPWLWFSQSPLTQNPACRPRGVCRQVTRTLREAALVGVLWAHIGINPRHSTRSPLSIQPHGKAAHPRAAGAGSCPPCAHSPSHCRRFTPGSCRAAERLSLAGEFHTQV